MSRNGCCLNLKGDPDEKVFDQAYHYYEQLFDPVYGGFGGAPKFPASHNLSFVLRHYKRTGEEHAIKIVTKTLDSMHRGIYDLIGFGFARYSTDEK